jgi:hypothetical protein
VGKVLLGAEPISHSKEALKEGDIPFGVGFFWKICMFCRSNSLCVGHTSERDLYSP